ncbi:MAG: alpha-ketoglutarate-dependent dioxygenase AlkB [Actinomycetota bacterium]|nr:alpha-ketoglutarate-dependent dioxygenase AlkB [Actinomycetota bacterium]
MAATRPSPRRDAALTETPEGLFYSDGFVTEEEERDLVARLDGAAFEEVRMHGQAARRTVVHFGFRYDYEGWKLLAAEPMPDWLGWLRDRAAMLIGLDPEEFAEILVTRYPPGAGIGWHRDAPLFGPKVVGVSLLGACTLRFQRRVGDERRVFALGLAPRSVYVLAGAARWTWQHSIPATKSLRYSVTFRTLHHREASLA